MLGGACRTGIAGTAPTYQGEIGDDLKLNRPVCGTSSSLVISFEPRGPRPAIH